MEFQVHREFSVEGGDFTRAGYVSSEIKKQLRQLNVDPAIIKRTVVASYEAEVNVVAHAHSGLALFEMDDNRILITFSDSGPGIPDIDQAMQEGFSTASVKVREMGFGAGMGLSNIKKNADDLSISSQVGVGTIVAITIFLNTHRLAD